jgi:hypothetical protein
MAQQSTQNIACVCRGLGAFPSTASMLFECNRAGASKESAYSGDNKQDTSPKADSRDAQQQATKPPGNDIPQSVLSSTAEQGCLQLPALGPRHCAAAAKAENQCATQQVAGTGPGAQAVLCRHVTCMMQWCVQQIQTSLDGQTTTSQALQGHRMRKDTRMRHAKRSDGSRTHAR